MFRRTLFRALIVVGIAAALAVASPRPARGEVIELIVARVNDDIITQTELQDAERGVMEDIYAKNTGDALEKELTRAKTELLRDLITKKLLVQQAERLYDVAKMQDAFVRQFKEQQKVATNADLDRILKDEGMTLDEFKTRLIEINAPSSVIDMEVRDKIAVSDAEIEKFYADHAHELSSEDRASYREIVLQIQDRDAGLEQARALVEKARGGADFTELAKESSQVDAGVRGKVLGPFTRGELAGDIESAVFALKPGEVSDPIVVGDAIHVIRLETRDVAVTPPLATVRDKIYDSIEGRKFDAALREYLEKLWRNSDIHVADDYVPRIPADFRKYVK